MPALTTVDVPLTADSVLPPWLLYGTMPLGVDDGERATTAVYFEIAERGGLGRVTFEGLDAIRGSRGESLPCPPPDPYRHGDWVFVVGASPWLAERDRYERDHYATPLLTTHQHYVFQFHDEFIEAIAEGIWLDRADRDAPFAPPLVHPLLPFGPQTPGERFTSDSGLTWELRRSPRPDGDLIRDARYCSQRVFQLNLVLDGTSSESAAIWLRTVNGVLVSRMTRSWGGEMARREGFARPADFSEQWEGYLAEVAERRRRMGKETDRRPGVGPRGAVPPGRS